MEIKKSRGRPRVFDREMALNAALELFWSKGYEGASLSNLTAAMKINAPSLYAAFGSKPALYLEVLALYWTKQSEEVSRILVESKTAYEAIYSILKFTAAACTQKSKPTGCLISSGMLRTCEENIDISKITASYRRKVEISLESRIKQGLHDNEFDGEADAKVLASFYNTIIEGISIQAIDGTSEGELNKTIDMAMRAWPK
jgi:AcrR family transcriptional regulator